MGYTSVELNDSLHIESLYTIHYFEYMSTFSFEGESHDFWEFLYVDKGEVEVTADDSTLIMKKGEVLFHKPNEFHNVKATGQVAPNLVVVSFSASGSMMSFFEKKLLPIDEMERTLLADIIVEARNCFSNRLDDPYLTHMQKKSGDTFGAEQMLRLYLEHFLIHLIRRYSSPIIIKRKMAKQLPKSTKSRSDTDIFNRISDYLEVHISSRITIEQICRENLIGRSQLQKIFREKCNMGVIEYFSKMKIDAAKQLIRTKNLNFTQISEKLGYTSVHYFSRQFKQLTGMTPSEYASSIRAVTEAGFQ